MTGQAGDLAADQAELETMQRALGAHLAMYRKAAGVTQPQLGAALGRTRSAISKIENGARGMAERLWKIADGVCLAEGALITEHSALSQAQADYRGRCRLQRRQAQQAVAQAEVDALRASPQPSESAGPGGGGGWPGMDLVSGELAEELMAVITRLAQSVGRREAIRTAGWVLAALSAAGLNPEEYARVARAVTSPGRVDAHVINNLAITLANCKRQEDTLGPCEVIDTVLAQHGIVRRLLDGDCPEQLRKALSVLDSNMAATIGGYLVDMCHFEAAKEYFGHARRAGHDAGNAACAAYAAANTAYAAFLRGDTPTALDMAAASRSLAARTHDARLKALAEQRAAAAYALDGQYNPCMTACTRAHEFLASANGSTPDSPAYWVHEGTIDSQRSMFLCLLGKPKQAVDAAINAHNQFNPTFAGGYARCQVRLGHALILDKDITEATRILGEAAGQAHLSPRLTAELHTTRKLLQPWNNTPAVTTLDTQLHACGLITPR